MSNTRWTTYLWWNLLFITLYVIMAILGIALAIPPGNVTPLYPASGLAFGAYLWLGRPLLPGIFLGAVLGNLAGILYQGDVLQVVSATLLIGVGETLAVIAGGAVLRRLVPPAQALENPRGVVWLFSVSLLWLVSPTVGVGALAIHGLIPWHAYSYTWFTWWLGDAVGLMLVTPLILLAWSRHIRPNQATAVTLGLLPVLLLYGTVVVTLSLAPWPVAFVLLPGTMLVVLRYETLGAALTSTLCAVLVMGMVLSGGTLYGAYALDERLLLVQLLIGVNAFTGYFLAAHVHTIARLYSGIDRAREESERDHLTGLLNRRGFERHALQALHQDRQGDRGLTLIMLDIDNFKAINDSRGHEFGDGVLSALGSALRGMLRTTDHAARLGGDEFVLLLDTASHAQLQAICDRLQAMTGELAVRGAPADFRFSLSGGIAHSTEAGTLEALTALADKRLYQAKQQGKNRLVWPD